MGLEQLEVREIVKQSVNKTVDIPEFQREFIWDPQQVKLLAESLCHEYPVGSFLLWDSSEYQEAKTAESSQASLWIVDGQQRTTGLCILLGMKPYWWPTAVDWNRTSDRYDVMANILPEGAEERLEFALPNPIRRRDARWLSIRRILSVENVEDLTPLAQEIVERIASDSKEAMSQFGRVHASLQRLWQIRERTIPIIKISHEVEDVAEIFARLNRAGTRVKEADVILALAAVRNPGWVREEYLPYCNDLEDRGWDLAAGVFIRTMTGIGRGRARLKEVPKEFWGPDKLPSVWKDAKGSITEVLKRLTEFGIPSADLLPSANSLIPLFVLHNCWGSRDGYRFERALHWFLLANWDGRYSGSAITSLNEDVRAIAEAGEFAGALDSLASQLRVSGEIGAEEFLNRYDRAGNRFLRLMLYMVLFRQQAKDWVDGSRLGYDKTGSPFTTGYQPQWHHIYPRGLLKKAGIMDDSIHALSNITVLNERTNVNKLSGKAPWRYIRQFKMSAETLRAHLVPELFIDDVLEDEALLEKAWALQAYPGFVVERAELLADEANSFLHELHAS